MTLLLKKLNGMKPASDILSKAFMLLYKNKYRACKWNLTITRTMSKIINVPPANMLLV